MFTEQAVRTIIIEKIDIAEGAILELKWMLVGNSTFWDSVDDIAERIANLRKDVLFISTPSTTNNKTLASGLRGYDNH